ncbi:Hypothetical_protein [Hexamita inflata]|uniref:Hypothetical_protein n=1 Tax=Hexamita inflata TaxID=28002 RepID=A0AA86NG33_9EUKA|nr:Hypothetical protein HINF_LOCUS6729 [Hexamita inflata]
MHNQTQLEEHNTNIESKNQPEILITQAKAHPSKQPASQVISIQEAKLETVKVSKAEVTTANANKTALGNLVNYQQLQAQPKVHEKATQAQKIILQIRDVTRPLKIARSKQENNQISSIHMLPMLIPICYITRSPLSFSITVQISPDSSIYESLLWLNHNTHQ